MTASKGRATNRVAPPEDTLGLLGRRVRDPFWGKSGRRHDGHDGRGTVTGLWWSTRGEACYSVAFDADRERWPNGADTCYCGYSAESLEVLAEGQEDAEEAGALERLRRARQETRKASGWRGTNA